MAFDVGVIFRDTSGNTTAEREAAELRGLKYGYKLNGGDATATFSLLGNFAGRLRWAQNTIDAVDMTIVNAAGYALWRGRFLQATSSPDEKRIDVTYVGYWANTASKMQTRTYTAPGPTTLKNIVADCASDGK